MQYPALDLNYLAGYKMVRNLVDTAQPQAADETYVLNMGVLAPAKIKPGTSPLHNARWYMDGEATRRTWRRPVTPLLHTKGECGASGAPILSPKESTKVVEIVVNNLSPTAHVLHMHGMYFDVINYADYSWCYFNQTACFFEPAIITKCPHGDVVYGDPTDKMMDLGVYWGCRYNAARYNASQNLATPLRKDSISIPRRGWAVIRIRPQNPGFWLFHCHMEQHIPLGMMTVLNVLPSQQPPIPRSTPTEGPCPGSNWEPHA